MFTVQLPIDGLRRGRVPDICFITGRTDGLHLKKVELSWYPPWVNIFFLLGILPGVIVSSIMSKRVSAELPFAPWVMFRWHLGQVVFVLSILVGIIGGVFASAFMNGTWLVAPIVWFGFPWLVWRSAVRGRGIAVKEITDEHITIEIPSERAAMALGGKLSGAALKLSPAAASALEQAALQTTDAPERSACAKHPNTRAPWCCGRCGAFFCPLCAEYPAKGGNPVCAACFSPR